MRHIKQNINFLISDVVALAASILELTKASRQARTSMWCALITTVLFDVDPDVATAQLLPPDTVENEENGAVTETDEHIMSKDSSDSKAICIPSTVKDEISDDKIPSTSSGSVIESKSKSVVVVNKLCLPSSVYEGTPNLLVNTLENSAS